MGKVVLHMQKIKRGAVGGIQSHNNREHTPKTNLDVDPSRSHENYDIIPCDNFNRMIKSTYDILCDSKKAMRADAVAICNFIVTSDEQTMKAMSADTKREFFEDSVKWFADRYGSETILNATVHMDETTPHMHIGIMPLHDGRWSAKTMFTPMELTAIQTEFAKDVGERYGLERGIEGSDKKHLSEQQFKAETAKKEMEQAVKEKEQAEAAAKVAAVEAARAAEDARKMRDGIESLEKRKRVLQGEIEALEGRIMTAKEISTLEGKKTITGGLKGVSFEDYEVLKRTAAKVDGAESRALAAEKRAEKIIEQAKAAVEKARADRPSMKMQMEMIELKRENETLKKLVNDLKAFVKEHAPRVYEAYIEMLQKAKGRSHEQGRDR